MYDDYYGPGSEEYDRDTYEEFQRDYQEFKQEYEQGKWEEQQRRWEEQQREQMYKDERALQETLEDAAREDCYADYPGGKGLHIECDYHTGSSSTKSSSRESAIIGGVVACIIIAIIVAIVLGKKKPSRY